MTDIRFINLNEDEVLNSDFYAQISPYATANYWARSFRSPLAMPILKLYADVVVVAGSSEVRFSHL